MKKKVPIRGVPVKHEVIHSVFARILRGIHYRHEFARRNADVRAATERLFDLLGISAVQADAFLSQDGAELTTVIAAAYRAGQRRRQGPKLAGALRAYFSDFGVLPVAPVGKPFLPKECRAPGAPPPKGAVNDDVHRTMRRIWNAWFGFEIFAVAEFGLQRPIMMPVLPLQRARLRSGVVDLRSIVALSHWAYPVHVDLRQPPDVLSDYVCAVAEQTREGELLAGGGTAGRVLYSEQRVRFDHYDHYLEALDIPSRKGNRVDKSLMKKRLFATSPFDKKESDTSADIRAQAFFRRSFKAGSELVKHYRTIL